MKGDGDPDDVKPDEDDVDEDDLLDSDALVIDTNIKVETNMDKYVVDILLLYFWQKQE